MTGVLNRNGEVADFWDVSQFAGGRSAYACVAFSAALCFYAGPPGHGPTGSGAQVATLAETYYAKLEGSDAASNTNGMSLQAEYTMLSALGLHYFAVTPTIASVIAAVKAGYAVLLCVAETSVIDLAIGRVPYSWVPTGNHAIVVSGVAADGNLLVRDTANIGPAGLRPDPRTYSAKALEIVSATAVTMPVASSAVQEEELPILDITNPTVARYFELDKSDDTQWLCRATGKLLRGAMLQDYRTNGLPMCGLSVKRLPLSNEVPIEVLPGMNGKYAHLAGKGITVQFYEAGAWVYDPQHLVDDPPDAGSVYPLKLYDPSNPAGQGPLVTALQAQLAQAKATIQAPVSDPVIQQELDAATAKLAQVKAIVG